MQTTRQKSSQLLKKSITHSIFEKAFPASARFGARHRVLICGNPTATSRDFQGSRFDTRKHLLYDHSADGIQRLISVIGGKLTTAAELARECI